MRLLDKLINNIVQECGITKARSKSTRLMFTDLLYGTACCTIIAVTITLGFLSYRVEPEAGTRLASNTVTLADQLAYGAKVVLFTGQK